MYTIIGGDGKEYGPVPADKVRDWIAAGRANAGTKIRRDGETEWTTVGLLGEFEMPPPPGLEAPPAPKYTGDAKSIAADLNSRAAPLDIFSCIGRSFELWKDNLLPLVGVTFVVTIVMMVLGLIPFIGFLSNILLSGVFYGGMYYYYLGKIRGEHREFGDAFAGFTRSFVPLMLATLLSSVILIVFAIVMYAPWILMVFLAANSGTEPSPFVFVGFFVSSLPVIYIAIAWTFTFAIVMDLGLPPLQALEVGRRVVTRNWFRVFFLLILSGIIAMLGIIGLFVGIFFTIPLFVGALMYAYDDLFNPPPAA